MSEHTQWLPRVAECTEGLAPLSGIACDVADLLDDPEVGPEQLDAVLRLDPILTLKLLSAANRQEVGPRTVEAAVNQLGVKRSTRIVSESLDAELCSLSLDGYECAEDYWVQSVSMAVIAESLAGRLDTAPPPQAFVAALLHDVGSLATGLCREVGEPFTGDRGEFGASFLESLGIPSPYPDVCRFHGDPASAPFHTQAIVEIVSAAREVADIVDRVGTGEAELTISAPIASADVAMIVDEARLLLAAIRAA